MDYSLFFNDLSLPAADSDSAYSLLLDAFQGALQLNAGEDRFFLYFDEEYPEKILLTENFTYSDFLERLLFSNEEDMNSFILEMEDKAPCLDVMTAEEMDRFDSIAVYMRGEAYLNRDILIYAWLREGVLLSLATAPPWKNSEITIMIWLAGEARAYEERLWNISTSNHGTIILRFFEGDITEQCKDAIFTGDFLCWFNGCKREDRNKIREKVRFCYERQFRGGRPLIDTLNGSRFSNMKELRVGAPHGRRGQIRVLFALDREGYPVILTGFIKTDSDYTPHIRKADELFEKVVNKQ